MDFKIELPPISEEELTPTVKALLDIISQCVQIIESQNEEIQQLKDEIARLKGRPPKPKIEASVLDGDIIKKEPRSRKDRKKRQRKATTYREEKVKLDTVPCGSKFIGYKNFTFHNIEILSHTIFHFPKRAGQLHIT